MNGWFYFQSPESDLQTISVCKIYYRVPLYVTVGSVNPMDCCKE